MKIIYSYSVINRAQSVNDHKEEISLELMPVHKKFPNESQKDAP